MISALNQQLENRSEALFGSTQILFLVVTDDPKRDRYLAGVEGANVWLVDSANSELIVPEGQRDDFFGLRYGLEKTIRAAGGKDGSWRADAFSGSIKEKPFVTFGLIAVNVIWFIVLMFKGDPADPQFMWEMGADFGYSVFVDKEFYRLLFSMFMHFSFMHLAGNMLYLGLAGVRAERMIGHLRFFLIYMLSGLASSLISTAYYFLMTDYNTVSAGASGAIYGLIALIIYLTARNRKNMSSSQMYGRIILVVLFLLFSNFYQTGIDVVAHISGFVFGLLLSFAFLHERKKKA